MLCQVLAQATRVHQVSEDVKVFISWSGGLAQEVASSLRAWLPQLLDRVHLFMSDSDIAAGARGLKLIEAELAETRFGIVIVTRENHHAPWLNFEAGALSKIIEVDVENRVAPLLIDIQSPTELTGPLTQFQAKTATKAGVKGIITSLAEVAAADPAAIQARFEKFWPEFEAKIAEAIKSAGTPASEASTKPRGDEDILREILTHVRALRMSEDNDTADRNFNRPNEKGVSKSTLRAANHICKSHGFTLLRLGGSGSSIMLAIAPDESSATQNLDALHTELTDKLGANHIAMTVETL